jgi:uncharacterized lipoprotein
MKSTLSLISLSILALTLSACMHNRSSDYVNAKNNPSLKTPPGVNSPTFTDHNPIPQKSTSDAITAPSLAPPGLTEDEEAAKIALAEEKKKAKNTEDTKKADNIENTAQ